MKNKALKKILMAMLTATMLIGSVSATAFAQANENAEQPETTQVVEEQPAEQPATEETPFSTPGNGQLVDDKGNDSSKQFLTVQTKNGNTFYMVIDRAGSSENVYMMSLVDENDLAEFLDETKETEKKNLRLCFQRRLQHRSQKQQLSRRLKKSRNLLVIKDGCVQHLAAEQYWFWAVLLWLSSAN